MKRFLLSTGLIIGLIGCQAKAPQPDEVITDQVAESVEAVLPDFTKIPPAQKAVWDAFGFGDFDPANIRTQSIKDGLAVIFGYGGNILVSVGDDGVLLVDNQIPQIYETLLTRISELGGDGVDYVINTHWHFDHAEGNRAFGPLGAKIIAQENSRTYMQGDHDVNLVQVVYPQQAYEAAAIPGETFTTTMNLELNGEFIELLHFGPAHTAGDAIVWFKNANVVHMGDIANLSGFPFIDADNGGTLDGMIYSIRQMMSRLNENTIVVPGHGEVSTLADLESYVSNLETVRDALVAAIEDGKSISEIQGGNIASVFGEMGPLLVGRAYAGPARRGCA